MQVIVVGGFLGSGKTTTIINMGKYLAECGKKIAIIVNEVGEVGIDGDVINKFGFETKEITNGCICCSLKVSLRTTVTLLAQEYKPDVLLIEPTGIAFPHVIKEEIELMNLGESVSVAPLVTLIDGSRFKHLMKEVKEFAMRQIIDAQILGINKVDLIEPIRVPILEASVHQLNPEATVLQLSGKATDERFVGLMQLLLPELREESPTEEGKREEEKGRGKEEETSAETSKEIIIEASAHSAEPENSIEASGVGSYAVEFTIENQNMSMELSREITGELMGTIKERVLALNPEFIGHIKLFLDNGTETIKKNVTIYSEEPQEEIIKSNPGATPKFKILSAVSKVSKHELTRIINSSVEKVFEKENIGILKKENHHEHKHEHENEHEHELTRKQKNQN